MTLPTGVYQRKTETLEKRFWPKVEKSEGCWIWKGTRIWNGYGRIKGEGGKMILAHRAAYELTKGKKIPSGFTLDHLCRNRNCVNPEHLQVASMRENMMRGKSPSAIRSKRGSCDKGHPYSKDSKGRSICKQCKSEYDKARYIVSKQTTLDELGFKARERERETT